MFGADGALVEALAALDEASVVVGELFDSCGLVDAGGEVAFQLGAAVSLGGEFDLKGGDLGDDVVGVLMRTVEASIWLTAMRNPRARADRRSAAEAALADEVRLREAVRHARAHGRSWNQLATALGVSRQAARQRFSDKVPT